jgi:hypothetical protein
LDLRTAYLVIVGVACLKVIEANLGARVEIESLRLVEAAERDQRRLVRYSLMRGVHKLSAGAFLLGTVAAVIQMVMK